LRCYARPGFVFLRRSFRNPRLQERLKVFAQDQTPAANFRCSKLPGGHELVNRAAGNPRRDACFVDAKGESIFGADGREKMGHWLPRRVAGSAPLVTDIRACGNNRVQLNRRIISLANFADNPHLRELL
jgi:hypothetical protein